jgi:hypothetical protein
VAVSGPSPLADCEQPVPEGCENAELEPWIAINPTNPDNLVVVWMQDCSPRRAHVTAVSFDGGATWETVVIPGLTVCSGGEWYATDPWLSFAANGDLYHAALHSEGLPLGSGPSSIVVTKSVDGGRTWGDVTVVSRSEPPLVEDKESITADPDDPCKVYVGWTRFDGVNRAGKVLFSRTTDCGETWSEPQELYSSDPTGIGFQALPALGGNLLAFFRQFGWGPGTSGPFYVMRSPDAGAAWPNEPAPTYGMQDRAQKLFADGIGAVVAVDEHKGSNSGDPQSPREILGRLLLRSDAEAVDRLLDELAAAGAGRWHGSGGEQLGLFRISADRYRAIAGALRQVDSDLYGANVTPAMLETPHLDAQWKELLKADPRLRCWKGTDARAMFRFISVVHGRTLERRPWLRLQRFVFLVDQQPWFANTHDCVPVAPGFTRVPMYPTGFGAGIRLEPEVWLRTAPPEQCDGDLVSLVNLVDGELWSFGRFLSSREVEPLDSFGEGDIDEHVPDLAKEHLEEFHFRAYQRGRVHIVND